MAETDPQVLQVPQVPQVWQVPQDHLGYQEHQVGGHALLLRFLKQKNCYLELVFPSAKRQASWSGRTLALEDFWVHEYMKCNSLGNVILSSGRSVEPVEGFV